MSAFRLAAPAVLPGDVGTGQDDFNTGAGKSGGTGGQDDFNTGAGVS